MQNWQIKIKHVKCMYQLENLAQLAYVYDVVTYLSFQDILVNNDFLDIYMKVKEHLPDLKMRHGGDGVPKKPKARVHPMVKLKNYVEKSNLRLIDFFNRFDKDKSMSVTREEFAQGIEVCNVMTCWHDLNLHAVLGW